MAMAHVGAPYNIIEYTTLLNTILLGVLEPPPLGMTPEVASVALLVLAVASPICCPKMPWVSREIPKYLTDLGEVIREPMRSNAMFSHVLGPFIINAFVLCAYSTHPCPYLVKGILHPG